MPKMVAAAIAIAAFSFLVLQPNSAFSHSWLVDDGCAPGTSPDGYFWASGPSGYWFDDESSGYNDCHMYTPNTEDAPPTRTANWYLPVDADDPEDYDHFYNVHVVIDSWVCDYPAVGWARYDRYRYGHSGGISQIVFWEQDGNCDGSYLVNQNYYCTSSGALWDMWDSTLDPEFEYFIIVDAVVFNPYDGNHNGC